MASAATQTKVIRYKKWIDEIIRTTTLPPTPMSTPVPKKFDAEHLKTCLQYTRCNPYGLPLGCIFHGGLQLCLPWGDPTIDYSYSCENLLFIEQQIKDLTPTPSPTPRYD